MKKKIYRAALMMFVFLSILGPASIPQAGQVVTDSLKSWARDALLQEKSAVSQVVPNSIAVFYFQNRTGRADIDLLQKGLAVMLAHDLAAVKGVKVVERARIQALAEAMELNTPGALTPAAIRRMANMLGAFYSVQGVISKGLITDLKIKTDLMEVPDDMLLDQPVSAGDLADITSMEKEILFDVIATLHVQLSAAQQKMLEKPLSADIDALFLLFQAIDASDRGKYEAAEDLYRRALRQDPQLSMAAAAIDELQKSVLATKTQPSTTATAPAAAVQPGRQHPWAAAKPAPRQTVAAGTPAPRPAAAGEIATGREKSKQPVAAPAEPTTPVSTPPKNGAATPAESGTSPAQGKGAQHMSSGKIIAIGVGIAAIGALALAGGGGGGGGGGEAAPPPSQPPSGTPTAPVVTSSDPPDGAPVSCSSGSVKFVFSKVMDINAGQVKVSPASWKFTAGFGADNRILTVFWDNNCPGPGETLPQSVTFSLENFQDTSQTPLSGTSVFTFVPTM